MKSEGKAFDWYLLKRIFSYTRPYRKIFWVAVTLTLSLALLGPVRPLLAQYILDHCLAPPDTALLTQLSMLILLVLILQSLLQYWHTWQTNLLGQKVIHDLRRALFAKMTRFKTSYFDKTPIGTTVTRSVSDMETIADVFSEGLIIIIGDMLQLLVIITVMFVIDWRLSLISLSTVPVLLLATNVFKNKIKESFSDVRTQVAALNTFVQEHLSGMRIIQAFSREPQELEKFKHINAAHRDANIRSVWHYSVFFPVVEILSAISIGLIVWWGAGGVIREEVTFGNLVAFIMYINLLFRPIRELADKFNTLQMGMVSAERIFKVMDTDETEQDDGTIESGRFTGKVEFRDVWFAYDYAVQPENPTWILRGISFTIEPGEMLAIIGSTGAGKTTIIQLLNRFYEISKGEIFIDDRNIRTYTLESLRKNIGVVMQDVFLFSDSVLNNITLYNPTLDKEKVNEAIRELGALRFIGQLPGELSFVVQERGAVLSSGQRQLLAFIRAYCYNPGILVLDEATSSIDSETEALISKATENITARRTSIVIAHRLATVQHASRILVMEKGQIVETGSHGDLIKKEGHYRRLFEIQFEKGPEKNQK
jgi:ATP-binding cassette subfamily B protein